MDKEELLKKWLADEMTQAERDSFKTSEDYALNTEIINAARNFKAPDFSANEAYQSLRLKLKRREKSVIPLISYKMLYRVAAVFIIGVVTYFAAFRGDTTVVKTIANQKTTFDLPDKSIVMLNADSKVAYHKREWNNKRELSLEGEAFFKVAKGAKFDVKTSNGIVSVVGTQFNVKNRNGYFEVKCFEGIVDVDSEGRVRQLTKGNTFRLMNGVLSVDSTMVERPQWIDNKSVFKSVPLFVVLDEFERQYNMTVDVKSIDSSKIFTGGFTHTDIHEALTTITDPFNFKYTISGSKKVIISKGQQ